MMFNFSVFCKTVSLYKTENDWQKKGETAKIFSNILAPNYKGADETFIRMFNGNHKCRDLCKAINDILDNQNETIEFPEYIHQIAQKLVLKEKMFKFDSDNIDNLNNIINTSKNLPFSVQEGLLKSYEINSAKKIYIYIAEILYYSVFVQHEANIEYQEVRGQFIYDYQELLTQPPYALTNNYKKRHEKDVIWKELMGGCQKLIVHGLSGIGKSEFAKDIWRTAREFGLCKYMAWINYNEDLESSIYAQFLDLADESLAIKRNKLAKMLREMDDELLIIIDNFYSNEKKDKFLQELSGMNCRVLVTTKEILNYSGFELVKLGNLPFESCVELFKNYYTLDNNFKKISHILNIVGKHTLLIELIAKNAQEEEFTLTELIDLMTEKGISYSELKVSSNHENLVTEETIIRQTQLLFYSIQKRLQPEEIDLLIGFSIFKNLPFTKDMVREWLKCTDPNFLSKLIRLGWITSSVLNSGNFYLIHSVPAFCILSQFSLEEHFKHFYPLITVIAKKNTLKIKDQFYVAPYIKSFLNVFGSNNSSDKIIGLLVLMAERTLITGELIDGAEYIISAIDKYFRKVNSGDKALGEMFIVLGKINHGLELYKEARKNYLQAMNYMNQYNDLRAILEIITLIIITFEEEKRWDEVFQFVQMAVDFINDCKKNGYEEIALEKCICYIEIVNICFVFEDFQQARFFLEDAQEIYLKIHKNLSDIQSRVISIELLRYKARFLFLSGDDKSSREILKTAYKISEDQYGSDHPITLKIEKEILHLDKLLE